ncbi:MAG: hypothetical protein HYV03_01325 [Deltaproteobacteria bacterium]|nr:hypothetical protein [Deltaproteobacteria bacterium]
MALLARMASAFVLLIGCICVATGCVGGQLILRSPTATPPPAANESAQPAAEEVSVDDEMTQTVQQAVEEVSAAVLGEPPPAPSEEQAAPVEAVLPEEETTYHVPGMPEDPDNPDSGGEAVVIRIGPKPSMKPGGGGIKIVFDEYRYEGTGAGPVTITGEVTCEEEGQPLTECTPDNTSGEVTVTTEAGTATMPLTGTSN